MRSPLASYLGVYLVALVGWRLRLARAVSSVLRGVLARIRPSALLGVFAALALTAMIGRAPLEGAVLDRGDAHVDTEVTPAQPVLPRAQPRGGGPKVRPKIDDPRDRLGLAGARPQLPVDRGGRVRAATARRGIEAREWSIGARSARGPPTP